MLNYFKPQTEPYLRHEITSSVLMYLQGIFDSQITFVPFFNNYCQWYFGTYSTATAVNFYIFDLFEMDNIQKKLKSLAHQLLSHAKHMNKIPFFK